MYNTRHQSKHTEQHVTASSNNTTAYIHTTTANNIIPVQLIFHSIAAIETNVLTQTINISDNCPQFSYCMDTGTYCRHNVCMCVGHETETR